MLHLLQPDALQVQANPEHVILCGLHVLKLIGLPGGS